MLPRKSLKRKGPAVASAQYRPKADPLFPGVLWIRSPSLWCSPAALGLLFVATRWLSVVGAALLCLFYPLAFFAFLLLAGIAFVLFHYYRR